MLCAVPALRALRKGLPDAQVTLVGLPWADEFVQRYPYIDRFIAFPGFPGIPEVPFDASRTAAFFEWAQAQHFDLAVQLHGSGTNSNAFVAMMGPGVMAGFRPPGVEWSGLPGLVPYPSHGHESERLLTLARHFGLDGDAALEFPLTEADASEYAALATELALDRGDYVCVHPGARDPQRRWPAGRFAAVADALHERGLRVLLTGSSDEVALVAELQSLARYAHASLAGRTSLGGLACLIDNAALLVANDTGVAHLAAALQTPSVIVFSGSDPERWRHHGPIHRALIEPRALGNACRHGADEAHRCLGDACSWFPRRPGGDEYAIQPEDVIEQAVELLKERAVA